MSQFPSGRDLSDEFNKKYAERLEALFMEIGYAFVGQRAQVCREEPKEKKKRFKLFHSWSSWGIDLWYGTSLFIPCELTTFPHEDDFGAYKADTLDKDTVIYFTPHFENPKDLFGNWISALDTYICRDNARIFRCFHKFQNRFLNIQTRSKNHKQVGFQVKIYDDHDLFSSFGQTYWKFDNFAQTEELLVQLRDALL